MTTVRARSRTTSVALVVGLAVTVTACAPEPTASQPDLTFAVESPAPAPSSSAPPRLRVVTVGDSLMSGAGLDLGEAWPDLMASRSHLALTNLACGGMGFVVEGECGTAYAGFAPAVAALQPGLLIVESSSNDFWQDSDDIRSATAATVDELHEAAPTAQIVGLSTIWNDDPDVPDDTAVTSNALHDAIDEVGGTYIDVGQPLVGHPEWLQDDDVHPTARGQKAIEQTIVSALQDAGVLP
ncbi:MAG: lysophospholipase [Microbacterium sp.]|jgi:acyl-CoA thioesterase-1|nr:lysophospholipase [Microbacterium sp.]